MKFGEYLQSRETVIKSLSIQIAHLGEEKDKLSAENESLSVAKTRDHWPSTESSEFEAFCDCDQEA